MSTGNKSRSNEVKIKAKYLLRRFKVNTCHDVAALFALIGGELLTVVGEGENPHALYVLCSSYISQDIQRLHSSTEVN